MDVTSRLRRAALSTLVLIQLAACGSFPLPPTETIAVGQRPSLICRADEVRMCRDYGHELKCTCSPY